MTSYISSLDTNKKQSALNTCLKSLNNMIDFHTWDEEHQDFTEIRYSGTISTISDMTISHPRKVGTNIPLLGMISGTIPIIVGYTDGISISVLPDATKFLTTTETLLETNVTKVDSEGSDAGITKNSLEYEYKNGTKVSDEIYTTVEYISREVYDPETGTYNTEWYRYEYIDTIRHFNYNDSPITVFMRF